MNFIKSTYTVLLLTCFISSLNAQSRLEAGAELSYLTFRDFTSHVGAGVNVYYAQSEKNTLYFGFNYFGESSYDDFYYGNAISSLTDPFQIEIDAEESLSIIQLSLGMRRSLIGYNNEGFNLYLAGELNVNFVPVTTSLDDFDETLYFTSVEDGDTESLTGIHLGFGLGVEQNIGSLSFFLEGMYNFAATESNGQAIDAEVPNFVGASVGVKIPLYEF